MKNRGGRPTIEESQRRNHSLKIRINSQELMTFKKSAKMAGISVSEYIRQAVINSKVEPRITPEVLCLIRSLCGMDNNLNQLARKANAAGYTLVHQESLRLADRINSLLTELRR
ncbi:MAG: DUF6290 family protein [Rikenellaceae bacterium]